MVAPADEKPNDETPQTDPVLDRHAKAAVLLTMALRNAVAVSNLVSAAMKQLGEAADAAGINPFEQGRMARVAAELGFDVKSGGGDADHKPLILRPGD